MISRLWKAGAAGAALTGAFAAGMLLSSAGKLTPTTAAKSAAAEPPAEGARATPPLLASRPESFAPLVREVRPAVVYIFTSKTIHRQTPQLPFAPGPFGGPNPFEEFFRQFQPPQEFKQQSLGSGFLISKDGLILTNNHVIDGVDEVRVKLLDGREYPGTIRGADPKTDIALVQIKAKGDLPVARLGDSDQIDIGDWVVAIGNPFGLEETVTAGIVSAKGRRLNEQNMPTYQAFIQTDAAIHPGNSGGPLFNMAGEVVGINTAIVAMANRIGFAIPINMAKAILPQLRERGRVTRGWLGVMIQKVTPEIAESMDLKSAKGALVGQVMKDGPAAQAGIRERDVIVSFDGKEIEDYNDLPSLVASTEVGKKVVVKAIRDGKEKSFSITVAELKEEAAAKEPAPESAEAQPSESALGLTVQAITPEIRDHLHLTLSEGVVVTEVQPGGAGQLAGIQPADVVQEVNRVKVRTLEDFRKALKGSPKGKPVLILLKRGDTTFFVALQVG